MELSRQINLPPEIWIQILRQLTPRQIIRLCPTSRIISSICNDISFWKYVFNTQYKFPFFTDVRSVLPSFSTQRVALWILNLLDSQNIQPLVELGIQNNFINLIRYLAEQYDLSTVEVIRRAIEYNRPDIIKNLGFEVFPEFLPELIFFAIGESNVNAFKILFDIETSLTSDIDQISEYLDEAINKVEKLEEYSTNREELERAKTIVKILRDEESLLGSEVPKEDF